MPRLLILLSLLALRAFAQSPAWSVQLDTLNMFSSPRTADLNLDGTLDIVIGGGVEGIPQMAGVNAIDGASGQLLWQRPARNQVFGTAIFQDISGDGVEDVFIGGRDAVFMAINGTSGDLIWEFWPDSWPPARDSGRFHFYNPQWTPDLDQDGYRDLLIANGGDASAVPYDSLRPPGSLLLLSGLTGAVIAEDTLPDGHETYFAPLLLDVDGAGDPMIIFGSGGETVRGRLWAVPLSQLLNGDISAAQILIDDSLKGMIASPSLADLNADHVPDLIVPVLNARLVALDGATFSELWHLDLPDYEMYVAPCIGQFTGDATPDVFATAARGNWSFYADYLQFVADGATGQIVWTDTASHYQLSQANAADMDGDGWDEILVIQNRDIGWTNLDFRNRFRRIDVNDNQIQEFGALRNGLNVFSTPVIADLDGDQDLEVVYAFHPPTTHWAGPTGAVIERLDLNIQAAQVAWPGYMGRDRDGLYHPPGAVGRAQMAKSPGVRVFPNPVHETLRVAGERPLEMVLRDANGRVLMERRNAAQLDLRNLPAGWYVLELRYRGGIERVKVIRS